MGIYIAVVRNETDGSIQVFEFKTLGDRADFIEIIKDFENYSVITTEIEPIQGSHDAIG